jgi:methionine-rich copper-binding protein CopC
MVPLLAPLLDGKNTVDWQAVSVNGHRTKGSYGFDSMK